MAAYRDSYDIRGGKITLYRRVGRVSEKDGVYRQSDNWHAAIRVPGHKTLRRSLKTTNQEEAESAAEDLYQELLFKKKRGMSLQSKKFSLICESYLRHMETTTDTEKKLPDNEKTFSANQLSRARSVIRKFVIPTLGHKNIEDINDLDIENYIQERKVYWISGEGSKLDALTYKRGGKIVSRPRIKPETKEPSYNTINKDLIILRQVFNYARMTRIIDGKQIPEIKSLPKPKNLIVKKPSLSITQYRSLVRKLQWKIRKQINTRHKRSHQLLYFYILILANSGLRVAEAKNLKFRDVSSFKDNEGNEHIKIYVHGKGKSRVMVPLQRTKKYIADLKHFHKENAALFGWKYSDNMFVFSDAWGRPVGTFAKQLDNLMDESNLLYSEDGRKRTAGAFRKFYMTMRLIRGGVGIYDLAKNVGSSVAVIEKFYAELEPEHIAQDLTRMHRYQKMNPISDDKSAVN